jgi:NADPH:quinone reductase-like Zn-dependent oxidoreductase
MSATMRAIVYARFGPPEVLELREIPKPVPYDDEVLIRVRATTVTAADWRCRTRTVPEGLGLVARMYMGFTAPRHPILGTELAGDVEAVGKAVRKFEVGDRVFAYPGIHLGSYVEYRCISEDGPLARIPPNLGYEEAAALSFGGTTALKFFQAAKLQAGERVLVNGASGGVGTAAVQLAKQLGANVTAVCSTSNLELVRGLGADEVVDYTRDDFTKSGERWDVVVDTAGTAPWARSKGSLRDGGRLLLVVGTLAEQLRAPWVSMTTRVKVIGGSPRSGSEDLGFLAALAESGVFRPVIDRRYPFEEMVEAHRYVDKGHKRGNVVVTIPHPRGR